MRMVKYKYIYIDGAHTVYMDKKGHSSMFLMMGRGGMINVSKKLELVITSLIETKIVANRERFPKCSWFRYFRLI